MYADCAIITSECCVNVFESLPVDNARTFAAASLALLQSVNLQTSTSKLYLMKLQHVEHMLACIIVHHDKFDHITPVLNELHWLPIEYHIKFKQATLTHNGISTKPRYQLINHDILLRRMRVSYRISAVALNRFLSYLTGRKHHVRYGGRYSETTLVH